MSEHQSNALWPPGTCSSQWGDDISTDTHPTLEMAAAVCRGLREQGMGGERKVFPLFVWSSEVQQPPVLPKNWNWQEPEAYYDPREARERLPAKL